MPSDSIRFVSAQPDERHFVWQTHVYLQNLIDLGVRPDRCTALFGVAPGALASADVRALIERFPEADLRLYDDTRGEDGHTYAPSIQPHLIAKMLRESPEREGRPTLFHDCDVAFRRLPDFDRMEREHPNACLLSDTVDYIGYGYLKAACAKLREERPDLPEDDLFERMCGVVGIDPEIVRQNQARSGGAQYLLRGVGLDYWRKVYRDSIALSKLFRDYLGTPLFSKEPRDYLQVWTAGMWAYLWNLWLDGRDTVLHPELAFLFSGASSDQEGTILHMAGLQDELKHSHYNKEDWWRESPVEALSDQPYLFDHLPARTASREYADRIHRAADVPASGVVDPIPARAWRLLTWRTLGGRPFWDVERLEVRFDDDTRVVGHFASGSAGASYDVDRAFEDGPGFWGGRPERAPRCRPCLYLGFELDRPAVPRRIRITQHDGPHVAGTAVVQARRDDGSWASIHVARLDATIALQMLFHAPDAGHRARGWRVLAETTSSGFAWDVRRLAFFRGSAEEVGRPHDSGSVEAPDPRWWSAANAFRDDASCWGGRACRSGAFYIGVEEASGIAVDRVLLVQGTDHYAERAAVQVQDADGTWATFCVASGLAPGLNDIPLFDSGEHLQREPA